MRLHALASGSRRVSGQQRLHVWARSPASVASSTRAPARAGEPSTTRISAAAVPAASAPIRDYTPEALKPLNPSPSLLNMISGLYCRDQLPPGVVDVSAPSAAAQVTAHTKARNKPARPPRKGPKHMHKGLGFGVWASQIRGTFFPRVPLKGS